MGGGPLAAVWRRATPSLRSGTAKTGAVAGPARRAREARCPLSAPDILGGGCGPAGGVIEGSGTQETSDRPEEDGGAVGWWRGVRPDPPPTRVDRGTQPRPSRRPRCGSKPPSLSRGGAHHSWPGLYGDRDQPGRTGVQKEGTLRMGRYICYRSPTGG